MTTARNKASRNTESAIYISIWLIVALFNLTNMVLTKTHYDHSHVRLHDLAFLASNLLPLFILFLINNYLLLPRLLLRNKYAGYACAVAVAIALIWGEQILQFSYLRPALCGDAIRPAPHFQGPRHLLPMPLWVDLIYDLLVIGCNIAVALIFQRIRDRFEQESLMKANVEEQLNYLKAQINPHFYMNMLNNIHGMIEIDAEKAQEMVINLSKLMRYMLYESANERIELSSEIHFLDIYLQMMRQRFPEEKVAIDISLPEPTETNGVMIAPLLFLVFIENSFKHGISYKEDSFVKVKIKIEDGVVRFHCTNSVPKSSQNQQKEGIGLQNVQRRLSLIYGDKAKLNFLKNHDTFTVSLTIPAHETPHDNN